MSDLERRVRLFPYLAAALVLVSALVSAAVALTFRAGPTTLDTRALRLVDEHGQVRGQFALSDDGTPTLSLHDREGRPRAWLWTDYDGESHLTFSDGNGRKRVNLYADRRGNPALRMSDDQGVVRIYLELGSQARPGISVWDMDRQEFWSQPKPGKPAGE